MRAVLLLLFLALPLGAEEPRPIAEHERAAVELVARYLANGTESLWNDLAPNAPLRALPREEALRELSVRFGPRERATWTLQTSGTEEVAFRVSWPSGFEDGLALRMSGAKLQAVRTLAEPATRTIAASAANAKPAVPTAWLVVGVALLITRLFLRGWWKVVPAIGAIILIGAGVVHLARPQTAPSPARSAIELRELLPLREALARGTRPTLPKLPEEAREIGQLWLLRNGNEVALSGTPGDPLGKLRFAGRSPLAELIRARMALEKGDERGARAAFDRAIAARRDDLYREAASALPHDHGVAYAQKMLQLGSRDAAVWYAATRHAHAQRAERLFRTAWQLRPLPREELARDSNLLALATTGPLASLVAFFGPSEPLVEPLGNGKPLVLPKGSRVFVSGNFLRADLGQATLEVPGGGVHAPADAQLVAATRWSEERDAAALRDAAELMAETNRPLSPRLEVAVDALAHHNRWRDLLALTHSINPATEEVPSSLLVYRMIALVRQKRIDDARALAAGNAVRARMSRRGDAATLVPLAETMASIGEYDSAIRLFDAARTNANSDFVAQRIRELELRRSLVTTYQTLATTHFDIRYDPTINPAIASRIGDLLEAELARLLARFPPMEFRRTAVNVLFWETFSRDVTGSEHILGVYDGEITLPFAGVHRFNVDIVATITHELTHAIVAQATADNAPRWFQEGLAQRMELVREQTNAFGSGRTEEVIPLPLVDAVMESATSVEAIRSAYATALTSIHFLEDRFGPDAPMRLVQAFARGSNSEDALAATVNASAATLDAQFREWGLTHSMTFASNERFPYHHWYSPDIDPRIRAGFRFSRRPNAPPNQ